MGATVDGHIDAGRGIMVDKKITRAEKAGRDMGNSIIEIVNLMYQNNTAKNFYIGLIKILHCELIKRGLMK